MIEQGRSGPLRPGPVARLPPPGTPDLQPERRRLVTVTAAPGWGKSQLVEALTADRARGWLTLDPSAGSGGFADALLDLAGVDPPPTGALEPDQDPRTAVPTILTAWRSAGLEVVILDDAHELVATDGLPLLRGLVETPEPGPQLILVSRVDLGLVDDRRRGRGDVLEVDARHLALDASTVTDLLDRDLARDPALAARLVDATGGWPTLVQLLVDELRPHPPERRAAEIEAATRPGGPLASYLASEVIASLDDADREVLARTTLVGSGARELIGRLVGAPDQLDVLLRRGLVVSDPPTRDHIRVVPAVRKVLQSALLPELDPDGRMVVETAETLAREGAVTEALEVLTVAGPAPAIGVLLEEHGHRLLRAGELRTVARAAQVLPDQQRTPALDQLHAQALAFLGDWVGALDVLGPSPWPEGGPVPLEVGLNVGLIHHLRGDLEQALHWYDRAEEDPDAVGGTRAELDAWRATARWLRGEHDASRDAAEAAMRGATVTADDAALSLAHTAAALLAASDGDRHANEAHYRQALRAAERAGDRMQEARIRTNWGSHHLEEGDYLEAREQTDHAIELAERAGFAMIAGIAHCNRAEIMLRTGDLDQAIADAEQARRILAEVGARTEAYAHHLLGAARTERGELALAGQAFERSRRLAEPAGDRQAMVPAEIGLAGVLATSDPEAAMAAANRALELDGGMLTAEAHLAAAWIALWQGDATAAREHASSAHHHATERDNRAAVAEATTCLALTGGDPVAGLREALLLWRELDTPIWTTRVELAVALRSSDPEERAQAGWLERRLAGMGCPPPRGSVAHRLLVNVQTPTRTLIRALGGFVAERDGHTLTPSEWGSRKAQDLVKILVVRGERGIAREELADLLWPDQPYDQVGNRLSVALSLARTALAGDRDIRPIVSQGVVVRLDPEAVDVDVHLFARSADAALRAAQSEEDTAVSQLLQAEELYGGDLFASEEDAGWVMDRRLALRTTYLEVTRTIARLVQHDDPDLAIRMLLRLLDQEGYDEPAHLNLCVAMLRAGRHGEARQRFRLYESRMQELDLPVVPFHELLHAAQGRERAAS